MSTPRQHNGPDFDRYEFRRELAGSSGPNGSAVTYSTESSEYAPLVNPVCISRTGYGRKAHDFDRDGVCFWCDGRSPE